MYRFWRGRRGNETHKGYPATPEGVTVCQCGKKVSAGVRDYRFGSCCVHIAAHSFSSFLFVVATKISVEMMYFPGGWIVLIIYNRSRTCTAAVMRRQSII